jgi:anti-sigma regulatory factor (Ser/Thr protein kinase)
MIALDEALTNVILHGYRGRAGEVAIEIEGRGRDLVIRLRDDAPPYDPRRVSAPDCAAPLARRPLGGLGVFLMRECMDELTHRRMPSGGNELTMIKRRVLSARSAARWPVRRRRREPGHE